MARRTDIVRARVGWGRSEHSSLLMKTPEGSNRTLRSPLRGGFACRVVGRPWERVLPLGELTTRGARDAGSAHYWRRYERYSYGRGGGVRDGAEAAARSLS